MSALVRVRCDLPGGYCRTDGPLSWTMADRWLEGQVREVPAHLAEELQAMFPSHFHRMMPPPAARPAMAPPAWRDMSARALSAAIAAGELDAALGPIHSAEEAGKARKTVLHAIRERSAALAGG